MNRSKWMSRLEKFRELGVGNILMCLVTRFRFRCLHSKFKFDPWHYKGTYYCRPYQRRAVKLVNKVAPQIVVEVGCGLGEIITRVNASQRVGYDIEKAVIEAAKYFRGNKVDFRIGTGEDVKEEQIDVLIALNWIHDLSPSEVNEFLGPFYGRTSYFLLEGITHGQPGYKFYHDFSCMKGHAELIETAEGGIGEPRKLMLFRGIKNVC